MKNILLIITFVFTAIPVFAVPAFFNYEGVLEDGSGNLITNQTVPIIFRILTTSNCILFAESQSMTTNNFGEFVAKIGTGTRVPGSGDQSLSVLQIFNQAAGTIGSCTVTVNEPRQLQIIVNSVALTPMVTIATSPLSLHAESAADSAKLGGYPTSDFVRFANVSTCAGGQFLSYSGTAFSCSTPTISAITSLNGLTSPTQNFAINSTGTSPGISSSGSTHTINLPMANTASVTAGLISKSEYDNFNNKLGTVVGSALSSGQIWVGNGSNQATAVSISGDATLSNAGVINLNMVPINKGGTGLATAPANGQILIGNGSGYSLNTIGGTANQISVTNAAGSITLSTPQNIHTSATPQFGGLGIGIAANTNPAAILEMSSTTKGILIPRMTAAQMSAISPAVAGLQVYNTDASGIYYYNGSAWQPVGGGGGGITSLNGLSAATQTFSIGTAGTGPAISSTGSVHTLNIPMASNAGVTAGLISKTDYDAFNNKLGPSTNFGGAVSGLYNSLALNASVVSSAAIQNDAVTSSKILDGTIVDADISTISRSKLSNGSAYGVVVNNNLGNISEVLGTTNGTILQYGVSGPTYSSASYPSSTAANQFLFSSAANVIGTISTSPNSFLVTNNSGSPTFTTGIGSAPQLGIASWQFSAQDSSKTGILSIVNSDFNASTTGSGIAIGTYDGLSGPFTGVKPAIIQSLINGAYGGELDLNPGGGVVVVGSSSSLGIGVSSPSALLHLSGGTTSKPPLKFIVGSLTSTPQAGSLEYDGTALFMTDSFPARKRLLTENEPLANSSNTASLMTCTGGSVTGNSTRGEITMGSSASCQINIPGTGSIPFCTLTPLQNMSSIQWYISAVTAGSLTVTLNTPSSGSKFNYICIR